MSNIDEVYLHVWGDRLDDRWIENHLFHEFRMAHWTLVYGVLGAIHDDAVVMSALWREERTPRRLPRRPVLRSAIMRIRGKVGVAT